MKFYVKFIVVIVIDTKRERGERIFEIKNNNQENVGNKFVFINNVFNVSGLNLLVK